MARRTDQPDNEDLARWLSRVALGDRRAFEQLYRATSTYLMAIAWRVLQHRDLAEEVLQDSFVKVWHSAGMYDARLGLPMTWLINIVRNKAIDALRSGKTERASTSALDDEAMAVAGDPALEPQRLLDDGLTKARIDGCMAALNASQRQALALAYYRGMVHTDIALALNAPVGTAKAWVRRGLDKLKDCLVAAGVGA
jgi:RNA polymerase sigma-70 factor (ECF subfamily)